MKQRKTFTEWLTNKLLIIIREDDNLAEKRRFKTNYVRLFLLTVALFMVVTAICFALVTTLLGRWFDPRVQYMEDNRALIDLEHRVDSLAMQVEVKEQYIQNIRNIMEGKLDFGQDELLVAERGVTKRVDLKEVDPVDSEFRKEFEDVDYEQLTFISNARDELRDVFLFPPLNGVVSNKYDLRDSHYGTDIVSRKDEPIKAVADGTVIMASWTQDSGYVMAIQHKNQLISFYKHNSVLLKKVGESVKTSDIIAIIGNSGELTDGPHLHFELWYKGDPIDPEFFISFE